MQLMVEGEQKKVGGRGVGITTESIFLSWVVITGIERAQRRQAKNGISFPAFLV